MQLAKSRCQLFTAIIDLPLPNNCVVCKMQVARRKMQDSYHSTTRKAANMQRQRLIDAARLLNYVYVWGTSWDGTPDNYSIFVTLRS